MAGNTGSSVHRHRLKGVSGAAGIPPLSSDEGSTKGSVPDWNIPAAFPHASFPPAFGHGAAQKAAPASGFPRGKNTAKAPSGTFYPVVFITPHGVGHWVGTQPRGGSGAVFVFPHRDMGPLYSTIKQSLDRIS